MRIEDFQTSKWMEINKNQARKSVYVTSTINMTYQGRLSAFSKQKEESSS
jgi:hypothetical protein